MEFAIWGAPPGEETETLLKSKIETDSDLEYWLNFVSEKGCTGLRVQKIDLTEPVDFGKMFAKTINKR
jgi:hypothetical protein